MSVVFYADTVFWRRTVFRAIWLCAALTVVLLGVSLDGAAAATGIRALDEPAVLAKAPDRDFLVAVARAGNRLVAAGEHGIIIYSDDNGQSWKQASVPVTVTLTDVAFADSQHGWAVGHYGVILASDDGGASWRLALDGVRINQLTMQAAQQSLAQKSSSPGAPLAMRRADAFAADGADKPLLSILVQDRNNVIIFGAYRIVLKTTDGGKSWVDEDLNIGDQYSHNLYDAVADGQKIVVVAETGLVFESSDGGTNFPAVASPGQVTLFGAVVANDSSIIAFGVAGSAFRSTDDCKTWQAVTLDTTANLTAGLKLGSGAIVLAAQDGRLFISNDNGVTFRQLQNGVPMSVSDMQLAANGDLVVAGNGGTFVMPAVDLN